MKSLDNQGLNQIKTHTSWLYMFFESFGIKNYIGTKYYLNQQMEHERNGKEI